MSNDPAPGRQALRHLQDELMYPQQPAPEPRPLVTGLDGDQAARFLASLGYDEDTANRAVADAMTSPWSGRPRDHYVQRRHDTGTFSVGTKTVVTALLPPPGSPPPWDPVPHLAGLIDDVHELAAHGGDPRYLGGLLLGAYASLRGGLLLDEPGREHVSTADAIREALGQGH